MSYNVVRLISKFAEEFPDQSAVKVPRRSNKVLSYECYSFRSLQRLIDQSVSFLKSQGIVTGERAVIMVQPRVELVVLIFALLRMGIVPVIIDPGIGRSRFLQCLRHSKPAILLGIPWVIKLSYFFPKAFAGVHKRIPVGKNFISLLKTLIPCTFSADTKPDQIAAILFTSGSTGFPKGVCYQHCHLCAQVEAIQKQYQIQPGEIDLPMLPVFTLFNPLMGVTSIIPEINPSRPASLKPEFVVQAIQDNKITNSFGAPALWGKVADHCLKNTLILPSIRRILMAGASAPISLLDKLKTVCPNARVYTPYGATEAMPVSTISSTEINKEVQTLTHTGSGTCVGQIFPNISLKIAPIDHTFSSENNSQVPECPEGEIGELLVAGSVVTESYDALPEATSDAKILTEGKLWHRMGDLGYLDQKNRIWFCGRKKESFIVNSKRYFTDCCEAIANRLTGFSRSALIQYRDHNKQDFPAMVLEMNNESNNRKKQNLVIEKLKTYLSQFSATKDIEHFFFIKKFPVDVRHNTKIHRLALSRKLSKS